MTGFMLKALAVSVVTCWSEKESGRRCSKSCGNGWNAKRLCNPLILQSHILSNKAILRLVNESRTNYIQIINIVYRLLKCGDYKLTT
jgi:hypothetical protein